MKNIWIIVLLFLLGCNSQQKKEANIYDEYISTFYDSYIKAKFENNIVEPNWNIGDTLIIDKVCMLSNELNDTLTFIQIKAYDTLIIKNNFEESVELISPLDSEKSGFISKRYLQELIPFRRYNLEKKIDFYDDFNRYKSNLMDSIIIKHELSETEFYKILAKENYRRTKREQFILY